MNTPVLVIAFNRIDTVKKLFSILRDVQAKQIYIAVDGPRQFMGITKEFEDRSKIEAIKKFIASFVTWDCELLTNYRQENVGCREAVSGAITWFLNKAGEGIILEDDCIPDPTFFSYATEMLDTYRNDNRVMHINGSNFQKGVVRGDASYYFSQIACPWGWATWKRAWKPMADYMKEGYELENVTEHNFTTRFFDEVFQYGQKKGIDSWDYIWQQILLRKNGMTITPNKNLITNIGHGSDATHTVETDSSMIIPLESLFEIVHPENLENKDSLTVNHKADEHIVKNLYIPPFFKDFKDWGRQVLKDNQ